MSAWPNLGQICFCNFNAHVSFHFRLGRQWTSMEGNSAPGASQRPSKLVSKSGPYTLAWPITWWRRRWRRRLRRLPPWRRLWPRWPRSVRRQGLRGWEMGEWGKGLSGSGKWWVEDKTRQLGTLPSARRIQVSRAAMLAETCAASCPFKQCDSRPTCWLSTWGSTDWGEHQIILDSQWLDHLLSLKAHAITFSGDVWHTGQEEG